MTDSKFVMRLRTDLPKARRNDRSAGGKGANLAEMCRMGLRVPPGFTLTSNVCTYNSNDGTFPKGLKDEVDAAMRRLSEDMGLRQMKTVACLGALARASMPGMMDTVLISASMMSLWQRWPKKPAMRALPGIAIGAFSKCMAMWLWVSAMICSKILLTIINLKCLSGCRFGG